MQIHKIDDKVALQDIINPRDDELYFKLFFSRHFIQYFNFQEMKTNGVHTSYSLGGDILIEIL